MRKSTHRALIGLMLVWVVSGCDDWRKKQFLYEHRDDPPCMFNEDCPHKMSPAR